MGELRAGHTNMQAAGVAVACDPSLSEILNAISLHAHDAEPSLPTPTTDTLFLISLINQSAA